MKEKTVVGTLVGIVIVGFILAIIWDTYQRNKLEDEGIYSIGKIIDVVDDHHASPSTIYEFKYKRGKYKGAIDRVDKSLIGKRFFVVFLPNNADISKMLIDKAVPPGLIDVPYNGWKSIPNE